MSEAEEDEDEEDLLSYDKSPVHADLSSKILEAAMRAQSRRRRNWSSTALKLRKK
jgi:hypothetical protein